MLKYIIINCLLLILTHNSFSQSDSSIYLLGASKSNEFSWVYIKILQEVYSGKNLFARKEVPEAINETNSSAALSFSKKNKRIYFFPLEKNELHWIDLKDSSKSNEFGKIKSGAIKNSNENSTFDPESITRSTMGIDGNGYALSNNGRNFYKFSDETVPIITNLGPLKIIYPQNENALLNPKSFNGDLITTTTGNLTLITGNGLVFKVDIEKLTANFLYKIKGINKNITISGAAVNSKNNIILVGLHGGDGIYIIGDFEEGRAQKLMKYQFPYSTSDLASGNLLILKPDKNIERPNIAIFPNPISAPSFNIKMDNLEKGPYILSIYNKSNQLVFNTKFEYTGQELVKQTLPNFLASDIYTFIITNKSKQIVYIKNLFISLK